jgi:putative glutamine amidotransferase
MKKLVVGIAAGRKFENYSNWMSQSPDLEVIKLSHSDKNFESIEKCNGLVLCGGEDVHPRFYNKSEYVEKYQLDDIDESRDDFELKAIRHVETHGIPLLGICRGLQIANVYFGGTLIPDIPSFGKPEHTKYEEGRDRYHSINVVKGSQLETIAGPAGEVNSAHHQSVDKAGAGLLVSAVSPDGIVEAMERKEKAGHPFMILVQWHPERMADGQSPFSKSIRSHFLSSLGV